MNPEEQKPTLPSRDEAYQHLMDAASELHKAMTVLYAVFREKVSVSSEMRVPNVLGMSVYELQVAVMDSCSFR